MSPRWKLEFLEPKQAAGLGWSRKVRFAGREFYVSVTPGKMVRIAYKPRGQNWGHHWIGRVVEAGKGEVWSFGNVGKSRGVSALINAAIEHEFMVAAFGRNYAVDGYHWDYISHEHKRYMVIRRLIEEATSA